MKKALKFGLPIIFVGVSISLLLFVFLTRKPEGVCSLELEKNFYSATVGEKFNIIDDCGLTYTANKNQEPFFLSDNTDILKVNATSGEVVCVCSGKANVIARLKVDEQNFLTEFVNIQVNEKVVYATFASIEKTFVKMSSTQKSARNSFTFNLDATVKPTVTYQNGYVVYNALSGEISLKDGLEIVDKLTETVTITIAKSEMQEFQVVFDIEITNPNYVEITKSLSIHEIAIVNIDSNLISNTETACIDCYNCDEEQVVEILESGYGYIVVKGLNIGESKITLNDGLNFVVINFIVS